MSSESERTSDPEAAPLEQVEQTVHSDLQYVSLQMKGKTYGGWYRMLPDGRMELLALANMHSERRPERTPLEQARGMLADFIRARPQANEVPSDQRSAAVDTQASTGGTLGDLLYGDTSKARIAEESWIELIQSVSVGDQLALYRLFERTHRIVFTLLVRLTNDTRSAEELTSDVFLNVWRHAHRYDTTEGTVVGWIMNHARSVALEMLRSCRTSRDGQDPLRASSINGVLTPATPLWPRLAQRIATECRKEPLVQPEASTHPEWEDVAPGISCKLLATDADKNRVSMLVRLAPGTEYPPHTHAGVEELHLLDGELWIDDRKLRPGDYNRAEPGTADKRVWSETGCTCVLMTSPKDVLG